MEENSKEESTLTFKKSTIWKVATFVFLGLFIISLFTGGFGLNKSGTGAVVNAPSGADAGANGNIQVSVGADDPILGNKDADISIIEFSDFQCPFCESAYSGAVTALENSDYFKSGKINLVYKEFPLTSIHPFAEKAAEAAECANRQGKFWEYHNKLFENQQALDVPSLKQYAVQLNLDITKFNKCLDSGEAVAKIQKDTNAAAAAGGQGTPYFVLINKKGQTQVVSGAQPYSSFETAIKALQ